MDVTAWLRGFGLKRYEQAFRDNEIDWEVLPKLTSDDLEENVRAADIVLTAEDLAEIDRIVPPGAASGTRYPIGRLQRLNV